MMKNINIQVALCIVTLIIIARNRRNNGDFWGFQMISLSQGYTLQKYLSSHKGKGSTFKHMSISQGIRMHTSRQKGRVHTLGIGTCIIMIRYHDHIFTKTCMHKTRQYHNTTFKKMIGTWQILESLEGNYFSHSSLPCEIKCHFITLVTREIIITQNVHHRQDHVMIESFGEQRRNQFL